MSTERIKTFSPWLALLSRRQFSQRSILPVLTFNWQVILIGTGLFGIFVALLATIQFATPNLAGNDGYYHIKLAQVMREQGLRPPFPWLPLTILNPETYYDHHFLYHVMLLPFTFGDLRQGAKWASVFFRPYPS